MSFSRQHWPRCFVHDKFRVGDSTSPRFLVTDSRAPEGSVLFGGSKLHAVSTARLLAKVWGGSWQACIKPLPERRKGLRC